MSEEGAIGARGDENRGGGEEEEGEIVVPGHRWRSAILAQQPDADLISDQRSNIRERGHIDKRQSRPAPTASLTAHDGKSGGALGAEGEKDHDGERDRQIENFAAGALIGSVSQGALERVGLLILLVAKIVNHAERRDDDFASRKRSDRGTADPPIPAQRPNRRLDPLPHSAEVAMRQVLAGDFVLDDGELFGGGGRAIDFTLQCRLTRQ